MFNSCLWSTFTLPDAHYVFLLQSLLLWSFSFDSVILEPKLGVQPQRIEKCMCTASLYMYTLLVICADSWEELYPSQALWICYTSPIVKFVGEGNDCLSSRWRFRYRVSLLRSVFSTGIVMARARWTLLEIVVRTSLPRLWSEWTRGKQADFILFSSIYAKLYKGSF